MVIGEVMRWMRRTVSLAFLLAAAPVAAGNSAWYVAGGAGLASAAHDFGSPGVGWSIDGKARALSVEFGYSLRHNLAVEAGYADLGGYHGEPRPCETREPCPLASAAGLKPATSLPVSLARVRLAGSSLSLVPRWPLGERLALFGRLGYLSWNATITRSSDGARTESPSNSSALVGAGAQYGFASGLGVLVEVVRSDIAHTVSVGTSWRF